MSIVPDETGAATPEREALIAERKSSNRYAAENAQLRQRVAAIEEAYRQLSVTIGRFAHELRVDFGDRLRALAVTPLPAILDNRDVDMTEAIRNSEQTLSALHIQIPLFDDLGGVETRALLLEIEQRGVEEDHYVTLGNEMAIGARSLIDSLPGSMLEYQRTHLSPVLDEDQKWANVPGHDALCDRLVEGGLHRPVGQGLPEWEQETFEETGQVEQDTDKEVQDVAPADATTADGLLYLAWVVIANAGGGDWSSEGTEWHGAATRWRDQWHEYLDVARTADSDLQALRTDLIKVRQERDEARRERDNVVQWEAHYRDLADKRWDLMDRARDECTEARREVERIRRVNREWEIVMSTLIDGLAERGVPMKLGGRYTQAALDEIDRLRATSETLRGERDALLTTNHQLWEQVQAAHNLRDEVTKIAKKMYLDSLPVGGAPGVLSNALLDYRDQLLRVLASTDGSKRPDTDLNITSDTTSPKE